jgi:hypothetical protein
MGIVGEALLVVSTYQGWLPPFVRVIEPAMGCAFWEREPVADDE